MLIYSNSMCRNISYFKNKSAPEGAVARHCHHSDMCLILPRVATFLLSPPGTTPTDPWGGWICTDVLPTVICTLPGQQSLIQKSRYALETGNKTMSVHPLSVLVASVRGRDWRDCLSL